MRGKVDRDRMSRAACLALAKGSQVRTWREGGGRYEVPHKVLQVKGAVKGDETGRIFVDAWGPWWVAYLLPQEEVESVLGDLERLSRGKQLFNFGSMMDLRWALGVDFQEEVVDGDRS